MLFTPISVAILLSQDRLQLLLINKDQYQLLVLSFPTGSIHHQEIINADLVANSIITFVQEQKIKPQSAVLFLTSELIYQQRLPLDTPGLEEKIQLFYDSLPLASEQVGKKQIDYHNEAILIGTNLNYYQTVSNALHTLGWSIPYVVPATLFLSKETEVNINPSTIKSLTSDTKLLTRCNLLENGRSRRPASFSVTHRIILMGVIILLVLLNIGVVGLLLGKMPVPPFLQLKTAKPQQIISSPPTATRPRPPSVVSTRAPIQKNIKIEILNGSGVAGLAASVSAVLKEEGFTDIQTGNAPRISSDTILEHSEIVTPATLTSLMATLDPLFTSVIIASVEGELEDRDIVITTGRRIP